MSGILFWFPNGHEIAFLLDVRSSILVKEPRPSRTGNALRRWQGVGNHKSRLRMLCVAAHSRVSTSTSATKIPIKTNIYGLMDILFASLLYFAASASKMLVGVSNAHHVTLTIPALRENLINDIGVWKRQHRVTGLQHWQRTLMAN